MGFTAMHFVLGVSNYLDEHYQHRRLFRVGREVLIRVSDIKTPMTKGMYEDRDWNAKMVADTPWGTLGNPMDVALAAVFLASEDAAWVTGIALSVDGGLTAH